MFFAVVRCCAWRATKLALNAEITKIIALSRPEKQSFATETVTCFHK